MAIGRGAVAFSRLSARSISKRARHARRAWSGWESGAFQNAMIASPMYLSIVAPLSIRTRVIGVRKSLSRAVRETGSSPSDSVVKPRMSQNRTVSSRSSPPSFRRGGVAGQLVHHRRRQVEPERIAHEALVALAHEQPHSRSPGKGGEDRPGSEHGAGQNGVVGEEAPRNQADDG